MHERPTPEYLQSLKQPIWQWARELGFAEIAFAPVQLDGAEERLSAWLRNGYHGTMDYMARHGLTRARPQCLQPETQSILVAKICYQPGHHAARETLASPSQAYIARYALGRDYHKLVRQRLDRLAQRIAQQVGPFQYRAFSDSAPIMEVELARKTRLGWEGKHTLLLNKQGSWFFLGELLMNLDFPPDSPHPAHCGTCSACIQSCPTAAIVAPYQLDARRCISYLTIEHAGPIPVELRPLLGNRIYGCDDCQLACPWNRFSPADFEPDFAPRNQLDSARLLELFSWDEACFLMRTEGSAIRRIGHERWLRNIAVALGNAPSSQEIKVALRSRMDHPSAIVREHLQWALSRQQSP